MYYFHTIKLIVVYLFICPITFYLVSQYFQGYHSEAHISPLCENNPKLLGKLLKYLLLEAQREISSIKSCHEKEFQAFLNFKNTLANSQRAKTNANTNVESIYSHNYGAVEIKIHKNLLPPFDTTPHSSNVSRLIYYRIWKNGNEFLRTVLYRYSLNLTSNLQSLPQFPCDASRNCKEYRPFDKDRIEKLKDSSRFAFTFIRHPISRFISGYTEVEFRYSEDTKGMPLFASIPSTNRVKEFIRFIVSSHGDTRFFSRYGVHIRHIYPQIGVVLLSQDKEISSRPIRLYKIENFHAEFNRLCRDLNESSNDGLLLCQIYRSSPPYIHPTSSDPLGTTDMVKTLFRQAENYHTRSFSSQHATKTTFEEEEEEEEEEAVDHHGAESGSESSFALSYLVSVCRFYLVDFICLDYNLPSSCEHLINETFNFLKLKTQIPVNNNYDMSELKSVMCSNISVINIIQFEQLSRAQLELSLEDNCDVVSSKKYRHHGNEIDININMNDEENDIGFYLYKTSSISINNPNREINDRQIGTVLYPSSMQYYPISSEYSDVIKSKLVTYLTVEDESSQSSICNASDHICVNNLLKKATQYTRNNDYSINLQHTHQFTFVQNPIERFLNGYEKIEELMSDESKVWLPLKTNLGSMERLKEFIKFLLHHQGSSRIFKQGKKIISHVMPMIGTILSSKHIKIYHGDADMISYEWDRLTYESGFRLPRISRDHIEHDQQQAGKYQHNSNYLHIRKLIHSNNKDVNTILSHNKSKDSFSGKSEDNNVIIKYLRVLCRYYYTDFVCAGYPFPLFCRDIEVDTRSFIAENYNNKL